MQQTWSGLLYSAQVDGPTLTAAAAATMLPNHLAGSIMPVNLWQIGTMMEIKAWGRISTVVTTPGTARFDVRIGGNVVFDSLAITLNTTAQTTVHWHLQLMMTCRAVGTSANFFGQGWWHSVDDVGSPAPTAGGSGAVTLPFNTTPAVGGNFNSTAANAFDMFFTQTVATGSMTLHQLGVWIHN